MIKMNKFLKKEKINDINININSDYKNNKLYLYFFDN